MGMADRKLDDFDRFVSYLPLLVIFVGLIGNTTCFFVFRFSKHFKTIPCMVFLSFVAIGDTASLFVWNLNHFLKPNFKIELEYLNGFSCRFFPFLQLFSLQTSSNLLSIMCIDRFFTIISTPGSIYSRLPFSTLKTSYIWSITIIVLLFFLNFHFLIFNGNYQPLKSVINVTFSELLNISYVNKNTQIPIYEKCFWYGPYFRIYPLLDQINLIVYNFIPFTIMFIFNILLISKTLMLNNTIKNMQSKEAIRAIMKKRRLTVSILSITFAFIILTMPSTISFSYFFEYFFSYSKGPSIINLIDSLAFFYHSSLFFNCFFTNIKFRKYVMRNLFGFKKRSKKAFIGANQTAGSVMN
ncbi:unnamed protein product [Brachionus calyciflorus]|uniref:G-protein coupled receptors family 1 profile domain-containing protein n=1 Tax=Brachionus calyciflorus TaxID=104777 RepID=A0A813Q7J0_9BILA|nr:unnamed protein product [Brachionus calyciflorus]